MEAIYQAMPIETSKAEIRLIAVLSTSTRDKLVCRLRAVSLLDMTPAYAEFLGRHKVEEISPSKVLRAWTGDEKNARPFPATEQYRFQWGDYAALSYVWGNAQETKTAVVNGVQTQITSNLAEALYNLHQNGRYSGGFGLWVDALCIDQRNNFERFQQVAKMRTFYSQAWSVIGFLGPETDSSAKAIDLVGSLAANYGDARSCIQLRDDLLQHKFDYFVPGSWLGLVQLLRRKYWQRLWIMQELALGGTRTVLHCGSRTMRWEMFGQGIGVIHHHLWAARLDAINHDHEEMRREMRQDAKSDSQAPDYVFPPLMRVWKDLFFVTTLQEARVSAVKFSRLLEIANTGECLDPRDKVYGMLGVMDTRLACAITTDYTSTAAETFAEVSKAHIRLYKNLEILRDANSWGPSGAPSWAIDWSWAGRSRDCRPDDQGLPNGMPGESLERRSYSADSGLSFVFPTFEGGYLGCLAVMFDTVDGLGCNPESERNPDLVQSLYSISAYGDVEQTACDLALALYAGRRPLEGTSTALLNMPLSSEEARRKFSQLGWQTFVSDLAHYHRWVSWFDSTAELKIGGVALKDYFLNEIGSDAREEDYRACYVAWLRTAVAGQRRLITTRLGRVGWAECCRRTATGTREVEPGDILAIFPGCTTPILLRQTEEEGKYKVIGEAYIQGAMSGEIGELLKTNDCALERIWLC